MTTPAKSSTTTLEPARFTDAEFDRLVRSGGLGDARVELRRGVLVRMNAQFTPHARIKRLVARAIEDTLAAAGVDWIVDTEASVAFGGGFEPMPDITVWNPGEGDASGGGPIPATAVRLIVEVADSTLADDVGEKLEDYAAAGLAEYWVADVQGKLILQHSEPSAATGEKPGYGRREPWRFGETIAWRTRPEIVIDTALLLTRR